MAFDSVLAGRIRKRLGKRAGLTEKKMFGGKQPVHDSRDRLSEGRMCP